MLNRTQTGETGERGGGAALVPSDDALHLLVIDDDTVHRMIICRVAAKIGYTPVEATSYDDAHRLLHERPFDCISIDLSLGRRGGVDVLRLLAELGCKAPIIIISGTDAAIRAEAMEIAGRLALNAYEPLAKPVNLAELRRSLTNIKLRTTAGLTAASSA
jgi:two-component system, chemotaxis family, chemotaxis protein CheY